MRPVWLRPGARWGVDISAEMIEGARALSEAEGLRNVTLEVGDAHPTASPRDISMS
jgi:ubiquinone/menaquinone biosynthesis C-methylase UbiE